MIIYLLIFILIIILFYENPIVEGLRKLKKIPKPRPLPPSPKLKPLPKIKPITPIKKHSEPKPSEPQSQLLNTQQNFDTFDTTNPNSYMILTQKNAANIDILKNQMSNLLPLTNKVQDLSVNVTNLNNQVDTFVKTQQNYEQQISSIKV